MEARTLTQPAIYLNGAAVLAHNAVCNRKPQPCSFARALGGEERIVNPLQVLGRNTLPVVTYIDARKPLGVPGLDREPAALFHGVASIQEQVEEDLLQFSSVALDGR